MCSWDIDEILITNNFPNNSQLPSWQKSIQLNSSPHHHKFVVILKLNWLSQKKIQVHWWLMCSDSNLNNICFIFGIQLTQPTNITEIRIQGQEFVYFFLNLQNRTKLECVSNEVGKVRSETWWVIKKKLKNFQPTTSG